MLFEAQPVDEMMKKQQFTELKRPNVDKAGAVASSVCALHCAACALLPAAFGSLGFGVLFDPQVEMTFTAIAIIFALGALILGWQRHRSLSVASLLFIGVLGLLISRGIEVTSADHHGSHHVHEETNDTGFSHHYGSAIGIVAGLFLLTGHIRNHRAIRCCMDGDDGR